MAKQLDIDPHTSYEERWGWRTPESYVFEPKKGLSKEVVEEISWMKSEPSWMRKFRLKAYDRWERRPIPTWGADLGQIDFNDIYYFLRASEKSEKSWDEVPDDIKKTFDRLGIPEAEQKFLGGVSAQFESESVYHSVKEEISKQGVLFADMDTAVREHPEIVQKYISTIIPINDNKLAALNSAVWSGGSFIYVPPGVKVDIPLQAYFRINAENAGQFERTLIIADEGSYVHYVEGCLPAGELIATAGGDHRPIEEIAVGDRVLTHDGRPERVTAVQVRDYRGPMYTFVPVSPDNRFRVTAEHPLLVVPREHGFVKRAPRNGWKPEVSTRKLLSAQPQWKEAKDVKAGDFLVFPKPKPLPARVRMPIEFARLAGYYLADGSASMINGCKALQFSFHIDDHESIDDVRRACKVLYDAEGSVTWVERKHEAHVVVYSPLAYEALRELIGTRSHNKSLAPELFRQGEEFLRNLVETYMRGDGNLTVRNGRNWRRAHTTSRVWAHQLQAIMARLGTFATINLERPGGPGEILGRRVNRRPLYRVQWTEGDRRSYLVRDGGEYFLVPVQRVDVEHYAGLVHNLDVRSPDSYLAAGFAVHNCTAPTYSSNSLHSAVVELIAHKDARLRYTTIQNWSSNVYNLVTKRAVAEENAVVEWVDGNIGSRVTMKYPAVVLKGRKAHGETLSLAFAGKGQHQDTGSKMTHVAPETSSRIISKSISKDGGRTSYRGGIWMHPEAEGSKSNVVCDALLIDEESRSDTYPYMDIQAENVEMGHEATVARIGDEQLFYLRSRGISESEAAAMIVRGFIEPITKQLPMEYAVELNRLIELEMEGSVG
ncbi:MAG: Fe-S cluster assembly protein SufB [Actinomycetota bacterium]